MTLTTETITLWRNNAEITAGETAEDDPEHIAAKAILALTAELLANREAQPVYQCRFFTTDVDGKQIGEWQDMDKGFYDQYDPYCRRILYTAPPAPAVPDEVMPGGLVYSSALPKFESNDSDKIVGYCCFISGETRSVESQEQAYADAKAVINACRAAMLAQPVSGGYKLPDGWKLVPVEPTEDMIAAAMNCDDVEFNSDETFCVNFDNIYAAMLAAAPGDKVALVGGRRPGKATMHRMLEEGKS
ncbi:hypothetical protein HWC14_gp37 [Serratia phage Parlo]|uniref:DUF551 domain-containing protein n=1 Tax=Serratia phage Parlo TaxID=2557554 RepID=A0A482MGZ1_9CAUD|nr:hypothetical protein HWC14_gp37 [Serratia phage Parlo]QBQ72186.1 hypothetical protein CPT_Parlo_037 [Serratia phage Parlo]